MKLYDFMKIAKSDYDVRDSAYDAVVTCCYISERHIEDLYDGFCVKLMSMVDLEEEFCDDSTLTAHWHELIAGNMELFRKFARAEWYDSYENDDDEFIYQWIDALHQYMAGNVDEETYGDLIELLEEIEQKENPLPYSFAQIEAAIKDRQDCINHLMTKDGNPKHDVRPEAIEANKIAVWAMQQVLELMVY